MDLQKALACGLICALATSASEAAVVVEIAAEAGPQANAQQPWLQRLTEAGAARVRVRRATGGEKPRVEDLGPQKKLIAVLTTAGVLHAPGGRFRLGDSERLREYLARLEDEGETGVTSARGKFGLTEAQFTALFDSLKSPARGLAGKRLDEILRSESRRLGVEIVVGPRLSPVVEVEPAGAEKLSGLSAGTVLAILLRQEGLSLAAEKPIGGATRLRVIPLARDEQEAWPVGYRPESSPRETAPALFEWISAEIAGFSLEQAIDAIETRLSTDERPLPIVWDRFALRREGIDPATTLVELAPKRTFYKRVIDKLAYQARLRSELRIDEAGRPFVWLSR